MYISNTHNWTNKEDWLLIEHFTKLLREGYLVTVHKIKKKTHISVQSEVCNVLNVWCGVYCVECQLHAFILPSRHKIV